MATRKNPAAVALGKLRAKKGPDLAEIGAIGGRNKARPTICPRCGSELPTAREAWVHCRKPRKAAGRKAAK